MKVSFLMNTINVVGNAIGIFVFHAGVAGVAVPTLVSRAVAGCIMIGLSQQKKHEIHVIWRDMVSWNREMAVRILKIAIPNGVENGMMKITYALVGGMGGCVILGLPVIMGFFELSEETYQLSILLIIMHNVMAFVLHPTSFVLSNSLRAAGDVKATMYIGIASMLVFRLGTAVVFGMILNMGVIGVWIAMGMDWLARSIAFGVRYKSGKWREVKVI